MDKSLWTHGSLLCNSYLYRTILILGLLVVNSEYFLGFGPKVRFANHWRTDSLGSWPTIVPSKYRFACWYSTPNFVWCPKHNRTRQVRHSLALHPSFMAYYYLDPARQSINYCWRVWFECIYPYNCTRMCLRSPSSMRRNTSTPSRPSNK